MGHLTDTGYTYGEHMYRAWTFASRLILTGFKTFLHGLYPDWYCTAATEEVSALYHDLQKH